MRAKFRRSKAIQETICLCCVVYCSSLLSIQAAEPFKEADSDADKISTAVGYFKKHEYKLADELLTSLLAALTERKDKTWTLVTVLNNLELTCEALGDQKRAEHYKAMRKEITKELDGAPSIVFSSSEPSNPVFMSQKAKVQPRRNVDSTSGTVYQRETQPQYPYAQSLQTRQQIRQPQRKKLISIVRVIALSENDKSLILHPTMGTKEIIDHYELGIHTEVTGRQSSYRVPVMKTVEFMVTEDKDVELFVEIDNLQHEYGLSEQVLSRCRNAALEGGLVAILENGMLLLISETVDARSWRQTQISLSKHPILRIPQVAVYNEDLRLSVNGEIIYSR